MTDSGLDPERVARVSAALSAGERDPQRSLCTAAGALVGVTGAGVVLVSGGRTLGNVCVSDPVAEAVEDVQYTLGEGPCVDACQSKMPVLVPDLESPGTVRWAGFREGARAVGIRAVFGFPLLIQTVCIGALNLYRDEAGPLSDEQFADAVVTAHVAGRIVLGWQAVAGRGSLAWQLEQVPVHRAAVHQATGMVSVQVAVSVEDALDLVRAHAFAEGRPIAAVAEDVVSGQLRLDGSASSSES